MNEYLNCNVHKCRAVLNGRAWVTRCMHVFCSEHGTEYFHNRKSEINCPVCNEVNIKENDTLFCLTSPSDMVLAGIRPERIIRLVEKSFKLWKCQTEAERRHDSNEIRTLMEQMDSKTQQFNQALVRKDAEWNTQLKTMEGNYNDITMKLRHVSQELEAAQFSLRTYKAKYDSLVGRPRSTHLRQPPEAPIVSPTIRDSLMDYYDLPGLNPTYGHF